jgi:general secretion pathway protein H
MAPRGFTLIETLIVLLIVGMTMTILPSLLNSLPGARLRAAADDLFGTLQSLRAQAITLGQSTSLSLDPQSRTYETMPATGRHALQAAMEVTTTSPYQGAEFHFFADGTATGGTITLRDGSRAATIAVDWLTGRIRRLD